MGTMRVHVPHTSCPQRVQILEDPLSSEAARDRTAAVATEGQDEEKRRGGAAVPRAPPPPPAPAATAAGGEAFGGGGGA